MASPTPEPLAGECPCLGLEAFTEDKKLSFSGAMTLPMRSLPK
jgi:hypothetical protein